METDPIALRPLQEYFLPESLPNREEQLKFLVKQFERYQNGQYAENVFLRGMTGTGKTATITHAVKKLRREDYVLIRGTDTRTPTEVLRGITDSSYNTVYRLLAHARESFRYNPRIIIIDEVDKVSKQRELFNYLNTIYRETGVPIIVISNKVQLLKTIPEDARTTLVFQVLKFESYTAHELREILSQRLDKMAPGLRERVPDHLLSYICSKGAKTGDDGGNGNARLAREVLLKCLINNEFTIPYVDSIFNAVATQDWVDQYNALAPAERKFLSVLLDLYDKKKGDPIKAVELKPALPGLSPQRISQLITSFEKQLIIKTRMVNAGSGGRYRTIQFADAETAERFGLIAEGHDPRNLESKAKELDLQKVLKLDSDDG